ncbi:DNA/RNA-binding domain E.t1.c1-type [Penicillium riverlandense]|uniref:DNA/RNA-binding domain E.t1.c1-type n=1 Tax=Penicillium riverlandense TaxID=1903569 RepID=UPI0025494318|nr:DNA/RNA-binding domain E.t1.c1-type [Penicillium riverlandense]KAJ5833495.1 DNA/RNA-binding domain E.t1.c1-type [Penicillium riverlandense]
MGLLLSEGLAPKSSMANRACHSASPPLSSGRANSTSVLMDDCTLDTISSRSARAVKGSPRAYAALTAQFRRQGSFRASPRRRRLSASSPRQLSSYIVSSGAKGWSSEKDVTSGILTEMDVAQDACDDPSQPPQPTHPPAALENGNSQDGSALSGNTEQATQKGQDAVDSETNTPFEMFRQPEINPITEDQLIGEVRQIYTGLVAVEKKCIELDKQVLESMTVLTSQQWQAMIAVHRSLLYEHHDFFLASQHPSASPVVKRLAEKYAMPARMWRYGIHSFLELLRHKLQDSLEYMLSFIYIAYSMMTLLLETVPTYKENWIECLGDLARYRMAVEDTDMRDREVWASVSRYWYSKDSDRNPEVGRIQHHLAVLARPDMLMQLFYYTKAMVSVQPFPYAKDSALLLFNPLLNEQASQKRTMITAFVAAHGALFTGRPTEQFVALGNEFLSLLRKDIGRLGQQGQQGVYITSCNLAAIFQYGDSEVAIAKAFSQQQHASLTEAYTSAQEQWRSSTTASSPPTIDSPTTMGASLTSHTLSIIISQIGDPNMYPSIHISLAFLWCLSLHPSAMRRYEQLIPWTGISTFLNSLIRPDIDISKIESGSFPHLDDGVTHQLAEDYQIRGQVWSRLYYPKGFFEDAPDEDERPTIEEPSAVIPRKHRCLWLGVRLATFGRWLSYDSTTPRFTATPLALVSAPIAESCGSLTSTPQDSTTTEKSPPDDVEMHGV